MFTFAWESTFGEYGYIRSYTDAFANGSWNSIQSPGRYTYTEDAPTELSIIGQGLLDVYEKDVTLENHKFSDDITSYLEAEKRALAGIEGLADDTKTALIASNQEKQSDIAILASAFDAVLQGAKGAVTTSIHHSELEAFATEQKEILLKQATDSHNALLAAGLTEEQKETLNKAHLEEKQALEDKLNKTIEDLNKTVEQRHELIRWLLAGKRMQMKSRNPSVTMTGAMQDEVHTLRQAIEAGDVQPLTGSMKSPSGLQIDVNKDSNGQLTFSMTFPNLGSGRNFFTHPRHNSKADLLHQAHLIRATGAKKITTNITHTNKEMAKQLAREAFEAALQAGFLNTESHRNITIKIQGQPMSEAELFEHVYTDKTGNEHKSNLSKSAEWIQKGVDARAKSQPSDVHREEASKTLKSALDLVKKDLTAKQSANTANTEEPTTLSPPPPSPLPTTLAGGGS